DRFASSAPACPGRGTRASKSPARAPALGSRGRPRRAVRREAAAARAQSFAVRSSGPGRRSRPAPAVHCQELPTSASCRACPASLAAVIVVVAKTVSKESGSGLECPNQAFLPVEEKVMLDHLQGRHVVGVYPLLTDETCWFLAADFDKASWTDD